MSTESLRFLLTGVSPLLMHNSRLVDPLDPWSREIADITAKRHKTIADHERLAEAEWSGSLWLHNNKPCIPATVIEGVLVAAARTRKRGAQVRSGIVRPSHVRLSYVGPDSLGELWKDERFRLRTPARTPGGRVMRTRPQFLEWQAEVEVQFLPSLVDADAVGEWLQLGGDLLGIGDFRPRFGRFKVERVLTHSSIGSAPAGCDRSCQDSAWQGSVGSVREERKAPPPLAQRKNGKGRT